MNGGNPIPDVFCAYRDPEEPSQGTKLKFKIKVKVKVKVWAAELSVILVLQANIELQGDNWTHSVCQMRPNSKPQAIGDDTGVYDMILDPFSRLSRVFEEMRPCSISKHIHWRLGVVGWRNVNDSWSIPIQQVTPVELFGDCPSIPQYLLQEGLPANLLRFIFLSSREPEHYWEQDYRKYITKRVHFDTGFVYETTTGYFPLLVVLVVSSTCTNGLNWRHTLMGWQTQIPMRFRDRRSSGI